MDDAAWREKMPRAAGQGFAITAKDINSLCAGNNLLKEGDSV